MNEFELIRRYFSFSSSRGAPGIALGVGDDCALVDVPAGRQLAITTDTLVSGTHFPANGNPGLIARRALRVNLSDLAAMGATPLGFQLSLTLPDPNQSWLEAFSSGLAEDAAHFACPLIGGDTTRGSLTITVTMLGTVAPGVALRRNGARAGDIICVSGTLGDAGAALALLSEERPDDFLLERYWLPEPRLALGSMLAGRASAGLDVSDGLLQDVGHIAAASGLCAVIERDRLPVSAPLREYRGLDAARALALAGGDDYELCFTAGEAALAEIERLADTAGVAVTRIGEMRPPAAGEDWVRCTDAAGNTVATDRGGYDHFS